MTDHDAWLEAPYQEFYAQDDQPTPADPDEPAVYPEDME